MAVDRISKWATPVFQALCVVAIAGIWLFEADMMWIFLSVFSGLVALDAAALFGLWLFGHRCTRRLISVRSEQWDQLESFDSWLAKASEVSLPESGLSGPGDCSVMEALRERTDRIAASTFDGGVPTPLGVGLEPRG